MSTELEAEFGSAGRETESKQDLNEFNAPNLSQEEYAEPTANITANALAATKLLEVVEVKAGIAQIHLMIRVPAKKEVTFLKKVVEPILRVTDGVCHAFIGKQYILKSGEMRFGWVISFSSNNLREAANTITEAIDGAIPHMEVTEAPLIGSGSPQSGGQATGRRGAHPL